MVCIIILKFSRADTISDILSYFLSLFLNLPLIIPNFLILHIVCSTIILNCECFRLKIVSSPESTTFFFFLTGSTDRLYSRKVILNAHISKVKHILNLYWRYGMIILVNIIIMFPSFLMFCLV